MNSSIRCFFLLLALLGTLSTHQYKAQNSSTSSARALDSLLQDYAFQAFDGRPRTGRIYDGTVPDNLTGIAVSVVRLRSGSLKGRGVKSYKEFSIPVGVVVQPYVRRVALVYQNLGNWSSFYYSVPGFTYLAPVLGLLVYNASNLSATQLPELTFVASGSPISINFGTLNRSPLSGSTPQCLLINLDGSQEFGDLGPGNVCSTFRQGHFSIVVNSTGLAPSPAPSAGPGPGPGPSSMKKHHKSSKVWKIVVGVVAGLLGLILLALLAICCSRYQRTKKLEKMEQQAEVGEALGTSRVGDTQAPVATGTRTQPVLENEYAA